MIHVERNAKRPNDVHQAQVCIECEFATAATIGPACGVIEPEPVGGFGGSSEPAALRPCHTRSAQSHPI